MKTTHISQPVLNLGDLLLYFFKKWYWFVFFGFFFAGIFAYVSTTMPNQYESKMLLADANTGGKGFDGLPGQLGGLASLAGVNLDNGKSAKLVAVQIFSSRKFLVDFVKKNKLEVPLFAVLSWDKDSGNYLYDEGKYNPTTKTWLPRPDRDDTYYPTDEEIQLLLNDLVDMEIDKTNKVTRVNFTWFNPHDAQKWLSMMVEALNDNLRLADINEKEKQMELLELQASQETNHEIKKVFYSLIQEQLAAKTLAQVRNEYIFKVVDPATLPETKSSPKRALITVLGGLVGGFLCCIVMIITFLLSNRKVDA